jgi:hypothetical protein
MKARHASFFEIKMRLSTNPSLTDAGAEQFVMAIKQALSMR